MGLANTIFQHLEFERHTFALIIYWESQPSVDIGCIYGHCLNYF